MVFVLGILTLLALVGIGLVASTRMDSKRVENQSNITSTSDSINSVVKQLQETLRQDIWGAPDSTKPLSNSYPVGSASNPLGLIENNEPYDGYHIDRWLSALMPYQAVLPGRPLGSIPVLSAGSNLFTGNTEIAPINIPGNPTAGEIDVLVWPSVSYMGTDLLIPQTGVAGGGINEFAWLYNTRNADLAQMVRYGPTAPPALNTLPIAPDLTNVPVIQTWPPKSSPTGGLAAPWVYDQVTGAPLPMIPGSNTNVPIRVAEEWWRTQQEAAINAMALSQGMPNFRARFPYFDTNGDGIIDLYDADGDGVPDSPISFVLDGNATNPQSPSKLYAIIRVVDHGAMINANVASSFAFSQNPPTALMFDESNANLQRRGRRATELLLDDVAHTRDIYSLGTSNRAWQLVNYRTRNSPAVNDPLAFDQSVVRRDLIGGLSGNFGYRLFGLSDEASLRHRFSLVPSSYGGYSKAPPTNGVGYDKIDTALPWSLLWSNTLSAYSAGAGTYPTMSYTQNVSRWSRMNANFEQYSSTGNYAYYDGFDINTVDNIGWRRLMTEDEPFSIRRPMFTTISRDVMLPPADLTLNATTGQLNQLPPLSYPLSTVIWNNGPNSVNITLNDSTDPWPMTTANVPAWMKLQPIDINMTGTATGGALALQARYMKYMASAMFIALAGVTDASGLSIPGVDQRIEAAWQFAANIGDYRDSDASPTTIALPLPGGTKYIHGIEKQPFFTEAYTRVDYNNEDGSAASIDDDKWFDAVELFIPPTWAVKTDKLYLRTPGSSSQSAQGLGIPLASFANTPAVLDGDLNGLGNTNTTTAANIDTKGNYYVFCGQTVAAPTFIKLGLELHIHPSFEFDHDSSSSNPGKVELIYADPAEPNSVQVLDTVEFNHNNNTGVGNAVSGGGPTANLNLRWATRSFNPAPNTSERFSMARCTDGWRFTIARWQLLVETPGGGQPNFETLGLPNTGQLNASLNMDQMPEMPWPSRSKIDHSVDSEVPNGFASGQPNEAFDSVIDVSRIPLVGNTNLGIAAPNTPPLTYDTATQTFWETVYKQMNPSGGNANPQLAVAAAHIDFVNAKPASMYAPDFNGTVVTGGIQQPWSWRLLRYLTATGHAFDRIDNDGDGVIDNDAEGPNTLFRMAGRINVNTAPVTVLRTVPSMSLLPDSLQFQQSMRITGETALANSAALDPYNFYVGSPTERKRFWDFATAIVAAREGRDIMVRQADSTGALRAIAVCQGSGVSNARVYESLGEVMDALSTKTGAPDLNDGMGNNPMFRADRYTMPGANLALMGHRLGVAGDAAYGPAAAQPSPDYRAFSPDFRERKAVTATGDVQAIEFTPVGPGDADANVQAGGIRGRDIYLSRWSNVLTTRSDVYTAYIALIDEDGKYVRRAQVTFDRSNCFSEQRVGNGLPSKAVLPEILLKEEGSYADDMR